jgi:hypothetical protein
VGVGEEGEQGEGGGKAQYFFVPIPMKRIVAGSRFGENQPTQHHRLGKWEVWRGGSEPPLRAGDVRGSS